MPFRTDVTPFDALLLVSYGGPEKPEDVVPFLERVTAGRGIPRERLVEVGQHYFGFGGRSPINDLNRAFKAAIEADFAEHGVGLPVYWGNRNWDPFLAEAGRQMEADGITHAAAFVTSAYSSYSGCRQYREDLFELAQQFPVRLSKLRPYFNHPGFVQPFVDGVREALDQAPAETHVVFVTHSIPGSMNAASGGPGAGAYLDQHEQVRQLVADAAGVARHTLAFCSRSGPPQVPWLEPDINDHLAKLAAEGIRSVVAVPIGFTADHMEVVYDLDTQAAGTAADLGLRFARVATPGTDPRHVAMVRELTLERAAAERGEPVSALTTGSQARPDHCPGTCCLNPRSDREALA